MNALRCRSCGREFSAGEQFCSQDGTRLATESAHAHVQQENENALRELDASLTASAAGGTSGDFSELPAFTQRAASADPLVGSTLDNRYRILRVIGEGGMGVVYEALHVLIEKHVAIKVLRDTFTGRVDVVERFRQEAKSASKIGHPNIVDVSDFGETPSGQSYIVMEMLIGEDLADVLARERALSPTRAVRIAYQIARALHATHKKNIVHRDLKPENIYLVERDGAQDVVKIVDFGVAKMNDVKMNDVEVRPDNLRRRLTRTGMLFGTPEYMSPEQALGKPFDHRVDIYALGAILFELVAGRVPFTGENFMEILAHHGRTPLPSLRSVNKYVKVSVELEVVIARALSKEPEGRHVSMGVFADELRTVPEMLGPRSADRVEPDEWPSLTGSLAAVWPKPPVPPPPPPTSLRAYAHPYPDQAQPDQDQTPFAVLVAGKREQAASKPVPLTQRTQHDDEIEDADDLDLSFDDATHEAVLLSPGAELRSSSKVGLALVVLASALLGVFVLQRSHASLRSLPSVVHSASKSLDALEHDPQADRDALARQNHGDHDNHELEQTTQAATAAPTVQAGAYADGLPTATSMQRPASPEAPAPPSSLSMTRTQGPAADATISGSHTRAAADATRHAVTPSQAGLEASVEVSIRTVPQGASVVVLGSDTRCEPTPCVLLVPKDRAVTLRAEAHNTSVQKTFTFGEESEIELRLSGRKPSGANAAATDSPVMNRPVLQPHLQAPSDLKVPSIFR